MSLESLTARLDRLLVTALADGGDDHDRTGQEAGRPGAGGAIVTALDRLTA